MIIVIMIIITIINTFIMIIISIIKIAIMIVIEMMIILAILVFNVIAFSPDLTGVQVLTDLGQNPNPFGPTKLDW